MNSGSFVILLRATAGQHSRKTRWTYNLLFGLVLALLPMFQQSSIAQELTATLSGTISDATGAVVPHALITVTQDGVNGESRSIESNDSGYYTLSNLAAGNYTIKVVSANFQTFLTRGVVLNVAQKRTVDAQLKAGSQDEVVTVQSNPATVDTQSSAQTGTVTGTQVRELELSNRNFEQLVTLQPGVVSGLGDETGFGLNNVSSVSVNGARDSANNWTVDGADINDSGSNGTLLNVPSIDAIQEFTLARGSYDAGYGRSGGAQILVATKQGTSEYHGDIYEFNRNDIFNANTFFNKHVAPILPRGIERYNDYGFTLGGPVYIPRVFNTSKDKLFFFWSEEWRKVSSPTTQSVPAASASQLNGMVAGQVANASTGCVTYDPSTDQSTINPACYSQNAKVYLANVFSKFPANAAGNNVATYSSRNNVRQDIVRLDWNATQKLHLFARAMQDDTPENFPTGLFSSNNFPGLVNTSVNAPGENVVANLTYTFSPRLVNEVEVAYSQGEIQSALSGVANSPAVLSALTNDTSYKDPYGRIPTVAFTGGVLTGVSQGSAPYTERNLDRTIFDNLSLTAGNHALRVGATLSQMLKTENASGGNPYFQFDTWQDFLLGRAVLYQQNSRDTIPDLHYYNVEAFAQDDWKLTPRLTLNLGVRWSYFPSPTDMKNTLNNFDALVYSALQAPALDAYGNFATTQNQIPATYTNGIIFPSGDACNAAKTISAGVTCSPYGGRVNPNSNNNFAPRVGFAYAPFGDFKTSIRGGFGIFFDRTLNGIWEQNAFQNPPLVQSSTVNNTSFDHPLIGTQSVSLAPNHLISTGTPAFKVPSYATYNLSVQQELLPSTVFEIAYVGSIGRHLLGELDLNQPNLAARFSNPSANVNAVRPFLGYSYVQARVPVFTSNYNSLQVSLNHRVTRGLTAGLAYTWSKNLSTQSNDRGTANTDTYSPRLDYGPTALNTPHIFIANYVYTFPFFEKQRGFAGHLLGGWEVSGITTVETGQSSSVTQPTDPFACTQDVDANGNTLPNCAPGSAPNTFPGGLGISNPNTAIAPRSDQVAPVHLTKSLSQWFTTNSFAPAVGHFGSERAGTFLGPGFQNWDLGALKNFRFSERYRFQFRGEFFNAFNHTNYQTIDTGIADASFGQVTATHLPRRVQLGAKLYF